MDDAAIREAAIRHCRLLSVQWGDAVPASELARGFLFGEQRIQLVGMQGVFKPKELSDGALTLRSTLASEYEDEHLENDEVLYDYAPRQREYENEGLKRIAALGRSVIFLVQVKPKPGPEYQVFAPVAILGFDDATRKVRLSLATASADTLDIPAPMPTAFSKRYAMTVSRARLHQAAFRRDTLAAYRHRCCICELRERPLLEAAHIVDGRLPEGAAIVTNGMAMCPTHHRAFGRSLLLVDENYRVKVQRQRLEHLESEPTTRMLLEYDTKEIALPRERSLWPGAAFLRAKNGLAA